MSLIETKSKFHVALDGVGLLLQGSPENPAYQISDSPVYGARFASGDRDYNDLSQWWYLIQTDWSGGIKDSLSFVDDAKFYYSTNIDARTSPGKLKLEKDVTVVFDNSVNNERVHDVRDYFYNEVTTPLFIDGDNMRQLSDGAIIASGGTDDIQSALSFKNYLWQFYQGAVGGVRNYSTSESDKTAQIDGVVTGSLTKAFGGVVVGDAMYIFVMSGAGNDRLNCIKTTIDDPTASGDWTLVFEQRVDEDASVTGIEQLGGEIIFTVENDSVTTINALDIDSSIVTVVESISGDASASAAKGLRFVRKFKDRLLITIPYPYSSDNGYIYEYRSGVLSKIWESNLDREILGFEADSSLTFGAITFGDYVAWGNLVYDGTDFFNLSKDVTDTSTLLSIPVGYSALNNELYSIIGTTGQVIYGADLDLNSANFKDGASETAYLVFSQHDKMQSIDKLLNSITVGVTPLLTGQSIEVYYMDDVSPSQDILDWTLLDTVDFAVDGGAATFKKMLFPDGTANKKYWFRVNLKSTTAGTPEVTDFTLEYLPIPDYKMQWRLNINCADEIKDLAGRLVETTGRELRSQLMVAWQTKSALDFQDLDYASAILSDNPLTDSATTVNADNTVDFPEKGRIKIEDEEMYYTGKTPTSFTGVTRGARGTVAVSHAQSSQIHNAYRVLVTKMNAQVPAMSEGKNLEYIVGFNLREV